MDLWKPLLDILILLVGAILLGGIAERLHLNAILGYLLAGTLLGPNAFNFLPSHESVSSIAELGVALLLFTIGLEFSFTRLRRMGTIALGGGSLQVLATGIAGAAVARAFGLDWTAATAVGAVVALSSTAAVLRLLTSRAQLDSVYGRNALGILLMQDVLVVPLSLLVTALGAGTAMLSVDRETGRFLGVVVAGVGAAILLLRFVLPRVLGSSQVVRNRDLGILLAVATIIGAAWGSHEIGVSPALGAFLAGLILAGSPFAVQIRSDVAPLRTLFMTLFFSAIGTQSDPGWVLEHWQLSLAVILAVVIGKAIITTGVLVVFRAFVGQAAATGVCLAQVGEFSFVLAEIARAEGVIGDEVLQLLVTATIGTLFLTPSLVALAPRLAVWAGKRIGSSPEDRQIPELDEPDHVILVGFGPAGQQVAQRLMSDHPVVVVDLSPKGTALARSYGLPAILGDARSEELLEALKLETARVVVLTLPDPAALRQIIERVRTLAPNARIVARARYHVHRWQLLMVGAHDVVDEEEQVGERIAAEVARHLEGVEEK